MGVQTWHEIQISGEECRLKCEAQAQILGNVGCCEYRTSINHTNRYCQFYGNGQIKDGYADAMAVLCYNDGKQIYL